MPLILNFDKLTEEEIRSELRNYDFELPRYFDFKNHAELIFCTKTRKVISVTKKHHYDDRVSGFAQFFI